MKKILVLLTLLCTFASSHTIFMQVIDNEDNTITVEGEYSTGEKTIGAQVRLESLLTGAILFKKRIPVDDELIIKIPTEPYQIVLDGGPGHVFVKEGIAPLEGFSKQVKNSEVKAKLSMPVNNTGAWSNPAIFMFMICLILILLAIYFSFKNTNRILNELRKNNK